MNVLFFIRLLYLHPAPIIPQYARDTHTSQRKRIENMAQPGATTARQESPLPRAPQSASEDEDEGSDASDVESLNSLPRVIDSVS